MIPCGLSEFIRIARFFEAHMGRWSDAGGADNPRGGIFRKINKNIFILCAKGLDKRHFICYNITRPTGKRQNAGVAQWQSS